MTAKAELQTLESQCTKVSDWLEIAKRALADLADNEYARKLASQAEIDCQEPKEYVQLAEFYMSSLNDSNYAEELLEQGEDACFESMEFAEIGSAYCVLLKNNEKGVPLIEEAAKTANKTEKFALAEYATNAGQSELAQSLMSDATAGLDSLKDFQEMSENLISDGKNQQARVVFSGAERHLNSVTETAEYANLMVSLFDDKEKAKTLLEDAEVDCQFPADYVALANGFIQALDNTDKARELVEEGADLAMEGEEHLDIAKAYLTIMEDKESALENFKQAVSDLSDREKILDIANIAVTQLGNSQFAQKCYEKAAYKISAPGDLVKLAVKSWELIEDTGFSMKLFTEAKSKMANAGDLVFLAESVSKTLGDTNLVENIYRDASESVDNFSGLVQIISSLQQTIENSNITKDILYRMESAAKTTADFLTILKEASKIDSNSKFCISLIEAAEENANSPADLQSVIDIVKIFSPENDTWISSLDLKLQKRQANQVKYAEFKKLENNISTSLEFIRLAKRVLRELDDAEYARNLIKNAQEHLEASNFDISIWITLIEFVAVDLKDSKQASEIATQAASNCKHFASAYSLAYSLKIFLPESDNLHTVGHILDVWETKSQTEIEKVRYIKAIWDITQNIPQVERLLEQCNNDDFDLHQLSELTSVALEAGNDNCVDKLCKAAKAKINNISQLISFVSLMRLHGTPLSKCVDFYLDGKQLLEDDSDHIRWIEGIFELFNDREWASDEFNKLSDLQSNQQMEWTIGNNQKRRFENRYF